MSDVLEILKRGDNSLEALLRAVLLDTENKVPSDRLRIVGAIADGAIIESGSNANGNWLKLADGTLICWGTYNYSFTTDSNHQILTVTLPAAALPGAKGSGAMHHQSAPSTAMLLSNFNLNSSGTYANFGLSSMSGNPPSELTRPMYWHVITRWKA